MDCNMPGIPVITNSWSLLMSIKLVMPSNHFILCHPLLLLPSIFPASGFFQMSQYVASGGQSTGVSASASVLPMLSFRMDWFDLFAVQGTLKSLLQHHSSKASILWCSAFLIVQLSHPYMTVPVYGGGNGYPLLPGKSHGQRNLTGPSPWGHKSRT